MQAARGASLNGDTDQSSPDPTPGEGARSDGTSLPPARTRRRLIGVFALVALLGYATDLVTKIVAVEKLTDQPPVPVIGDVLRFYLARNPGAAFSTGTSYTLVLSFVAIAAAVGVLWFARRLGSTGWALALGFLLAGVLGNLTDRIFRSPGPLRGHVVDFLQLPNWPIFNVADVCINIAAGLVILQALRGISIDGTRSPSKRSSRRGGREPESDQESDRGSGPTPAS